MSARRRLLPAVATAGLLLAGCGGSSHTVSTATGASSPSVVSGAPAGAPTPAELLSTCTATTDRSRLSAAGKVRYLTICREAVGGHDPAVEATAALQCRKIIVQTVPAPAQAGLIADCPRP
ncbi:MAG TPA: hypothetical protein VHX88_06665 [Solirubrobacteraceae bacterium]|jgi:hypothetical protein|nr:hypothetical protein [Solirubrobacteraceae bacterium]